MKVYLSEEQYTQLLSNGSITVGGTTVIYNPDDDYITPLDNKIYIEKSELDTALDGKLSLSGGTMTGAITYNTTTGSEMSSNYISAGGGFSKNSGKYGLKLLCCDQSDCQTGLGQDLTGLAGGYELTVVGGRGPVGLGYVSFAMHDVDSKDYTRLGYFDASGNFYASGSISFKGNNIQTLLDGKVSKNDNNRAYNDLVSYYSSTTVPTYYRITFPDSVATTWTMINMEITIRESHMVETGGKIFINAHHSSSTTVWTINASTLGNLTSGIKVYSSDGKYFYIEGCSDWSTISIDKVLVGDAATGLDLSDIKIDIVSELPETYQTATMYYGIHSGNIGSQSVASATKATQDGDGNTIVSTYAKKSGDTFTGDIILNQAALLLTDSSSIVTAYDGGYVSAFRSESPGGIFIGSQDAILELDSRDRPFCSYKDMDTGLVITDSIALLNDVPKIYTTQTGTTPTKTLRIYTDSDGYLHIDTKSEG